MATNKLKSRLGRKQRIRRHMSGTTLRPRLTVFRSLKNIYAQVIDDTTGQTLVSASSLESKLRPEIEALLKPVPVEEPKEEVAEEGKKKKGKKKKPAPPLSRNMKVARKIGEVIAQRCKEKNIDKVVFDRNGYKYHGRVKNLADAARKAGLSF